MAVGLKQASLNDPFLLESFVRRSHALQKVIPLLLDTERKRRKPNIVGLWGAGGYGKTPLAIEICREVQNQSAFPDGIVWVDLSKGLKAILDRF